MEPSGLTIHVVSHAQHAWTAIQEHFRNDENAMLMLTDTSLSEYLRSGATIWGDRIITIADVRASLDQQLEKANKQIYRSTDATILEHSIQQTLTHPDIPASLSQLAQHPHDIQLIDGAIRQIEEYCDPYVPHTAIEHGLATIRQELYTMQQSNAAAYQRELARRASLGLCQYTQPLLIAPRGQLGPSLGSLMVALAQYIPIDWWFVSDEDHLESMLAHAHIDRERVTLITHQAPPPVTQISAASGNEYLLGLEQLQTWIAEGINPTNMVCCIANVQQHIRTLTTYAHQLGVPLRYNTSLTAIDTQLGSMMLAGLRLPHQQWLHEYKVDTLHGQTWKHIMSLPRDHQFLVELVDWANAWCDSYHAPAEDMLWLMAFAQTCESWSAVESIPQHVDRIVETVVSDASTWGDSNGVLVCEYSQAAGIQWQAVVSMSLNVGEFPQQAPQSSFFSPKLLAEHPLLTARRDDDEYCMVQRSTTRFYAVRQSRRDHSILAASHLFPSDAVDRATQPPAPQTRPGIQRLVRDGATNTLIETVTAQLSNTVLTVDGKLPDNYVFSVTELEMYQRCPYGWFVNRILKPGGAPGNMNQQLGVAIHAILEQASAASGDEQSAIIDEILSPFAPYQQHTIKQQVTRALNVAQRWPYTQSVHEQALTYDIGGEKIIGNADHLLWNHEHLLVIDYKRSKSLKKNATSNTDYQAVLYPLMAQQWLQYQGTDVSIDGMMYYSLFHGNYMLYEAQSVPWFNSRFTTAWSRQHDLIMGGLEEQIAHMRNGMWAEIGHNCPQWCGHHTISQTNVHDGGLVA